MKYLNLKFFKTLAEMSNNWKKYLFGTNVDKTLESYWYSLLTILRWTKITSVIFKRGIFFPFCDAAVLEISFDHKF